MKHFRLVPAGLFLLLLAGSCSSPSVTSAPPAAPAPAYPAAPPPIELPTATNSGASYQAAPAYSSGRSYDYDVSGTDADGNAVSGSIDVTHNGGEGTLTDDNGNEQQVEVEWTGRGQLEGTDEEGNTYDLEVD